MNDNHELFYKVIVLYSSSPKQSLSNSAFFSLFVYSSKSTKGVFHCSVIHDVLYFIANIVYIYWLLTDVIILFYRLNS